MASSKPNLQTIDYNQMNMVIMLVGIGNLSAFEFILSFSEEQYATFLSEIIL